MSYFMLAVALVEGAVLIWAFRRWMHQPRNFSLLLSITILLPVTVDAFLNGAGRWIGTGPTLEFLTRARMNWFFFAMPFLLMISILLLNYAGVAWARAKGVVPAAFVVILSLGVYQIINNWQMELYPSCVFDVVRYVMYVPPDQACTPEQAGLGAFSLPIVVSIASFVLLFTSLTIWWKTGWPWLAVAQILLLVAVSIPRAGYLTFVSYPFDGILSAMLVLTSIHLFARRADTV